MAKDAARDAALALYRQKLAQDARWQERAIVVLYEHQTQDEQAAQTTVHHNGVGFSGCDAEFMSSLAVQLIDGRHLSQKQRRVAGRILPRYAGQLFAFSDHEKAARLVEVC